MLTWHIATVQRSTSSQFVPPQHHELIVAACLDLSPAFDRVKFMTVSQPKRTEASLATWLLQKISAADAVSSWCSQSFGYPVLNTVAIRHTIPLTPKVQHDQDAAVWYHDNISKSIGINDITMLLNLPPRPDLDIAAAYRAGDVSSVVQRLAVDCYIVTLALLAIMVVTSGITPEQYRFAKETMQQYFGSNDKSLLAEYFAR